MKSYYPDFWELFGLTPLTIWDLPFDDFISMTFRADQVRSKARETSQQ